MLKRWILCGYGRLGKDLHRSFEKAGFVWDLICATSSDSKLQENTEDFTSTPFISWNDLKLSITEGDVVVMAISDANIINSANAVDKHGITVIHCSGATALLPLQQASTAVFYPLQTFSGHGNVDWSEIPVFLEFSNKNSEKILHELANRLGAKSENLKICDSNKRLQIHLAAVFANNFTQAQVAIADQLLKDSNLSLEVLLPILKRMANQWGELDSIEAITGPAVRRDQATIQKHLAALEDKPSYKKLYMDLTEIIQQLKS